MHSPHSHPLSPAQSGMWYAHRLDPDSPAYHCLQYLDIQGAVDIDRLTEAVLRAAGEADGLWVRFDGRTDPPLQIPLQAARPEVTVRDLTGEQDPFDAAQHWLRAQLPAPFDLEAGHVCDFTVLRLSPERVLWAQRYHHIVTDGHMYNLMAHRVAEIYRALTAGQEAPAARFQPLAQALEESAAHRTSEAYAADRAYWHARFADRPESVDLTRADAAEGIARQVRRTEMTVPAHRHRLLRAAARAAGTTSSRAVVAALAAYTHRMTGREDIVVGLAVHGRTTPAALRFPGMMSDVLPLRLRLGADTTWRDLLADTDAAVTDAMAHQGYRSEELRKELGWPERRRFAGPLVNLLPPLRPVDFGVATATLHNLSTMPTEDFTLCCYRRPGGELLLALDVHPDRCDDATLAAHRERLTTLLDGFGADTGAGRIATTPLTGPAERARLLDEWNAAPTGLPDASLGELFRRQAARTPDAPAVTDGVTELTYAQLDDRSDRLAAALADRGARPGATVVVLMERSVDLLAMLLAVLRTGAAYVPLDERQPASRLGDLIARTGGDFLLVSAATRDLPVVRERTIPVVDAASLDAAVPRLPPRPPEPVPADATACVMYTSGSTGVPSGVRITHRNITALALDPCWRGGAHGRVLWHSPHAFDAVLYELWVPLLQGGQVCVAPPGPLSAGTLREMIARDGVTGAWLTAGLFAALAEEEPESLRGLRELWTGGDVVSPGAVARVFATCPGIVVVNGYGPTETTTFATRYRMTSAPSGPVPIGRAMADTTLYVLDPRGEPVPMGARGELWVGGAGVSAGYVDAAGAARERFCRNPFHPGRMYRTGDLVRMAPDGNLLFLGRADDQVKIRGFRVEPHDVEITLERHPDVARAVVVPREDATGGKDLVAYVVPAPPRGEDASESAREEADRAHTDEWRSIYEDMYRQDGQARLGEDFSGWQDSYRGTPIPREHMEEWRRNTVERVLELRPRRVLEIGVGSGLLLARLAPHCEEYWATDFSERALTALARQVAASEGYADRVRLLRREARDLSDIPLGYFDCVVVNSVAQYLPSAAYLSATLRGALDALAPGGYLYVGDIRPRRLLREFRTAVELRRSPAGRELGEVKRAVERAMRYEKELLVEPEFFTEHLGALPEVAGVDVRVKRGRLHNELTQLRYEALLRKAAPDTPPYAGADAPVVRWGEDVDSLAALGRHLLEKRTAVLRVTGVPNARVRPLLLAEREVCAGSGVAEAVDALDGGGPDGAPPPPDPEDFAVLGQGLGLSTVLTWSAAAEDGTLDVLFRDPRDEEPGAAADAFVPGTYPRSRAAGGDVSAESFTNRPGRGAADQELAATVAEFAGAHLPDYMVPAAYAVLDRLPLSANGKVNRKELPPVGRPTPEDRSGGAAGARRPADATAAPMAGSETEQELARLWADLLGVAVEADADADFFALGGHSLLATRLASRIRARFGVEAGLRKVFEHSTLGALAGEIDRLRGSAVEKEDPGPSQDVVPMSGFQERVWLDERLRGFGSHYAVPLTWRVLGGGLDPAALRAALGRVVERHEVLRTRFVEGPAGGGRPYQLVGEAWLPEVEHRVAEGDTDGDRLEHATAILRQSARVPFDPASGRLLRAVLVDLADGGDQLLLCCLHHLVWDVGSEPVFLRDLEAAYRSAAPGGTATADYEEWPATPHQQRMAFVERFERGVVYEDAPVYHNASHLFTVEGLPDPAELRAAVRQVMRRHPALRTTVHLGGELCTQRVHTQAPVSCTWFEPGTPGDGLAAWLREPFHLAEGPLLRVAAVPDGEGHCVLALAAHLAVVDRASLRIVARELTELLTGGQLPPPGPGFTAWWQARDEVEEEDHTARLAELCDGGGEPLRLPADRPRAAVHVYAEESVRLEVPEAAGAAAFAAREGVSAEAVLLAAYTAVLQWHSGQYDFTLGIANPRRDASCAELVGPVDDILPLRLRGTPEQTFASWVRDCDAGLRAVRALGRAPFDNVVQRVQPPKDMSRTALYDVVFDFLPDTDGGLPAPVAGLGKYDLHLTLRPTGTGAAGQLVYNGLYYDAERIRALAGHWQRLLREALTVPQTALGAFEPLSPQERQRQTGEANVAAADYPEATLHALVEEQARLRPGSTAVIGPSGALDYAHLAARSVRLSRLLAERGARPGTLVALWLGRGPSQIEAILAVLRAGAAYVPVDPEAPARRVAFILADSGADLLITDDADGELAAARAGYTGHAIRLDEADLDEADLDEAGLDETGGTEPTGLPGAGPDDLAYVIYTSGTTGRPKGVRVSHRNVVRLVRHDRMPFDFGPDDVWLLAHSYAFDFSVWEIFGCLVNGGRLVLPEADVPRDPERLAALVRAHGVTVLNQTPGSFAQLTQVTGSAERSMETLRYAILGGAAFRPATLGTWPEAHPAVRVVNMYGITETTVHVTAHTVTAEDAARDRSPIGSPVPTTTVRLLDPVRVAGRQRLLPVGAVGEICVGGAGVAAGYLGRPELEAERFVPDPFGPGRLYRSGDLGRRLVDGTLEYVGRIDDQLQVRGYRVEPGEIEACLEEHPGVVRAVVTADAADPDRLVAYVWCPDAVPAPGDLRKHLAERLPAHMVPSVLRAADHIPLSGNGKTDLAALAALSVPLAEGPGSVPRTPTGDRLADLWRELLPAEEVFADTSFFEAGGHSLLAATLLARIRGWFGVDLPVRTVFESPHLQELADRIDAALPYRDTAPSRESALTGEVVPASGFQRRIALDEQLSGAAGRYVMPLVWRVRGGDLDPGRLSRALDTVVARHEALRTGFVERDGQVRQLIGPAWSPRLHEVDLTHLPPHERWAAGQRWVRETAAAPFDPAAGQLLRAGLIDLGEQGRLFVLCLHHLVGDGPSFTHLLKELDAAYRDVPGVGVVQYREFVREQEEWVVSAGGRAGVERWRGRLAGAPVGLDVPVPVRPEPSGVVEVAVAEGVLERLRGVARREGVSWFMVVAAAFAGALHRWTGAGDVTFGCPVANRVERHAGVVGPCTNTVVLRSTVDADTTLGALLGSMRERVIEALEDQRVPFDQVIAALNPERRPGATPYADAALNLAPLEDAYVLGGATLTPVTAERLGAELKFGLTLTVLREDERDRMVLSHRGDRVTPDEAAALADLVHDLLVALAGDLEAAVAGAGVPGVGVVQYREFVREQEEWVVSAGGRAGVERWRGRLAGAPVGLDVPVPVRSEPSGVVEVAVAEGVLERLRGVARREGVSWFMVVAAAFAGALHRWTGAGDVTFGCPVANRVERHAGVVGPCTNTVVLRSTVDADTTLGALLGSMRERVIEALEDQRVPFDQVIAALNPERRPGTTPYADIALTPIVPETEPPSLGAHRLRRFPLSGDGSDWAAKGALTVSFQEESGALRGTIAHRGDRVGRQETERLAHLVSTVLDDLLARPGLRLADVPPTRAIDRTALAGFERGSAARPPSTVLEMFAAQARATPTAPAIDTAQGPLSYADLDTRARMLAHRIAGAVRRDQGQPVVALLLDRGPDLITAMLAAWYAGCAYCPLDPGHPAGRLAHIVADLGTSVVVTAGGRRLPEEVTGSVALLDVGHDGDGDGNGTVLPPPRTPDDTAYVIYTSGSTGVPKGVDVRHEGLAQHARWFAGILELRPGDRVAQLVNVGFDAAVSEVWPALTSGAVLVPHTGAVFPGEVARWLDRNAVTVSVAPAALAEVVWKSAETPESLRVLAYGGSVLGAPPPDGLPYALVNCYGPTEATVAATCHALRPDEDFVPGRIGRPAQGVQVYVVDAAGHRCPVGAKGEILIGGVGVARGYWRRPDLTAERFLPQGPHGVPGPVYRSGDLGRWLPDGSLEFVGRMDRQLKVRGHRIEPEEIETRLAEHRLVDEAAVHALTDGAAQLVAYAVPDTATAGVQDDPGRRTAVVLGELRSTLPAHLVPDAVVWLERLPRTAHGKVDFAALPLPRREDLVGAVPAVAPRGERETRIAGLWREVLDTDVVGVHDNFFDLGGDSLRLTALHRLLESAFGLEVPVQDLFAHPTVSAQARAVDTAAHPQQRAGQVASAAEELKSRARKSRQARQRMRPGTRDPKEGFDA